MEVTCCNFEASQIQWFVGIVSGVFLTLVGLGVFRLTKSNLSVGRVRPQVLLALTGLSAIGVIALLLGYSNVTSIAVGGVIALTMRIIDTDKDTKNEPDEGNGDTG